MYERELYAFVRSVSAFRPFLLGQHFLLRTDHQALAAIFNSSLKTSARVVKWVMRLQEFDFSIEYVKGVDNVVADALSRIPWYLVDPIGKIISTPSEEYNFSSSDSEEDSPHLVSLEQEIPEIELPR